MNSSTRQNHSQDVPNTCKLDSRSLKTSTIIDCKSYTTPFEQIECKQPYLSLSNYSSNISQEDKKTTEFSERNNFFLNKNANKQQLNDHVFKIKLQKEQMYILKEQIQNKAQHFLGQKQIICNQFLKNIDLQMAKRIELFKQAVKECEEILNHYKSYEILLETNILKQINEFIKINKQKREETDEKDVQFIAKQVKAIDKKQETLQKKVHSLSNLNFFIIQEEEIQQNQQDSEKIQLKYEQIKEEKEKFRKLFENEENMNQILLKKNSFLTTKRTDSNELQQKIKNTLEENEKLKQKIKENDTQSIQIEQQQQQIELLKQQINYMNHQGKKNTKLLQNQIANTTNQTLHLISLLHTIEQNQSNILDDLQAQISKITQFEENVIKNSSCPQKNILFSNINSNIQDSNQILQDQKQKTITSDKLFDISPLKQQQTSRFNIFQELKSSFTQTECFDEDLFPPFDKRVCLRCRQNDLISPNFCKYENIQNLNNSFQCKKIQTVQKKHIFGTQTGWNNTNYQRQSQYLQQQQDKKKNSIVFQSFAEANINTIICSKDFKKTHNSDKENKNTLNRKK